MKQKDITEYTDKQIKEMLADEQTNLTRQRLSHTVSPLENPMKIRTTRKTVARLKTEMKKRQLAAQANK
jgi:large subunit ribosomal protein L29